MSKSIPQGWKSTVLNSFCFGVRGVAYSPHDLRSQSTAETITLLRSNNIQELGLVLSDVQYVHKSRVKDKQEARPDDIAVCMSNGSKRLVGKSASFKFNSGDEKYTIGAFCSIFRPKQDAASGFVKQLFKSDFFQRQVDFSLAGSAINNLKNSDIEAYIFLEPPLLEQKKIAAILTAVDDAIESTQAQINKLKDLKIGMMQELLTKGIGHTEFKDSPVGRIPAEWDCVLMNQIARVNDGAHFTPTYVAEGVPFLRVTDLKNKSIFDGEIKYIPESEHKELIKRCRPEKGDILFSKNGTIGLTRLIDWEGEFSIFVSLALIKISSDKITSSYLTLFMESPIVKEQIRRRAKQGSVTNLHLEEIREFDIPLPNKDEQQRIVNILTSIIEKLELATQKYESLIMAKKALMQDLLTGKVRVQVN